MSERRCAYDENPAVAICTSCDEDICFRCHNATLTGFAVCDRCTQMVVEALRTRWESSRGLRRIHAFLFTFVAIASGSRNFFRVTPPFGPALPAFVFGCIAYAIGSEASTLWMWLFVDAFPEFISEVAKEAGVSPETAFYLRLGTIPIIAPMVLLFHIGLMHGMLRVVGASSTLRVVTRIVGYSSAAYLFQLVPPVYEFPLGHMMAVFWLVHVQLNAVRSYNPEIGIWKPMLVVFVPFALLVAFGAIG